MLIHVFSVDFGTVRWSVTTLIALVALAFSIFTYGDGKREKRRSRVRDACDELSAWAADRDRLDEEAPAGPMAVVRNGGDDRLYAVFHELTAWRRQSLEQQSSAEPGSTAVDS